MYNFSFSKEKFKAWLTPKLTGRGIPVRETTLDIIASWFDECSTVKCMHDSIEYPFDMPDNRKIVVKLTCRYDDHTLQINFKSDRANETFGEIINLDDCVTIKEKSDIPSRVRTMGQLVTDISNAYHLIGNPNSVNKAVDELSTGARRAVFRNHNGKDVILYRAGNKVILKDIDLVKSRVFNIPEEYFIMGTRPTLEMYSKFDFTKYEGEPLPYPPPNEYSDIVLLVKDIKRDFSFTIMKTHELLKRLYSEGTHNSDAITKVTVMSDIRPTIEVRRVPFRGAETIKRYVIGNHQVIGEIKSLR